MSDETVSTPATRATATRQAEHQTALHSLREFGNPLAPPDPVLVIDARIAALVDVYNREWEEFDTEASELFAVSSEALKEYREESERLAEEAAARKRQADADAEAAGQAAAVEAERKRAAEAKRVEDVAAAKRAENVAHRRGINQAVVKALTAAGLSEEDAVAVVTVVAKGMVPHMTIGY